jgi:hypothetical protein
MIQTVSDDVTLNDLPEGPHRALYALWSARRRAGHLPGRAEFDPSEMREILPHITIFDVVERNPLRFRIRLVGTAIVDAMDVDTTGRYLDELDNIGHVHRRAEQLVETGVPYFLSNLPLTWTHQSFKRYSVLGVPLAADGQTIDKLMYSMVFE